MCCEMWLKFCRTFHEFIDSKFEQWGRFVYLKTKYVIACSVLLTLILSCGFMFFDIYGQTERIFYPQKSETFKNLDRAEKHFTCYVQREEFILLSTSKDKNIISKAIFKEALNIHKHVIAIPGLDKFCIRNHNNTCITTSPLELFQFDEKNLENINQVLLISIQNETTLLSNGYNVKLNLPRWFGNLKINETTGAMFSDALRIEYPVKFGKSRNEYERNKKWEKKMLTFLEKEKQRLAEKNIRLIYNTVRSDDDSVEQNTKDNFLLICISIASMVLFCGCSMLSYKECFKGHFLVSLAGILCVTLGIACGFGITLFLQIPYVGFVGVLPFLILGVGIDDMFIILNQLDQLPNQIRGSERLSKAIRNAGFSITMTTLTDLVAFIIGSVSAFPAVRIFCMFAFFSLLFAYFMIITLFLALLTFDIKRIEKKQNDCLPCIASKNHDSDEHVKMWQIQNGSGFSEKLIRKYGETLVKLPSKIAVIIFAVLMLSVGIYGMLQTNFQFDYKVVGSDDSEYVSWLNTMDKHFPIFHRINVDIVLDEQVDYTSHKIQQQFFLIDNITKTNRYFEKRNSNWMTSFIQWKMYKSKTNSSFFPQLIEFLECYPIFKQDIIFNKPRDQIMASRVHIITKPNNDWLIRRDAMLSIRKDLKTKLNLDFYPVSFLFIYASHLVIILQSTVSNIAICCVVILLLTLPYVVYPAVSLLLLFNFACFIVELLGIMHFWGLSLNSITMIVMVMAVGFTVDYSCHVTHAYLVCSQSNAEKRMVNALTNVGLSVLKGGLSTLVGIIVLAFSRSKLFFIFFKMMFSIITLGLIHGLLILPVLLTIFCRTGIVPANDIQRETKVTEEVVEPSDSVKGELLRNTSNM